MSHLRNELGRWVRFCEKDGKKSRSLRRRGQFAVSGAFGTFVRVADDWVEARDDGFRNAVSGP